MTIEQNKAIDENVILKVSNLKTYFPVHRGTFFKTRVNDIKAVDDISFDVKRGETLGLVGESGCGKSTTGRSIVRLETPTSGNIVFNGMEMSTMKGKSLRKVRRKIQMIFQDPYASLNPRLSVTEIIGDPLRVHKIEEGAQLVNRVKELMDVVGLNPKFINRHPHEFSGGQRQRIGIARALAVNPDFIVCDEPISALDVSIQAQIINLLEDLQKEYGLTYLFIGHDLSVVRHISNRIAVMYLGKFVELTTSDDLYENPLHPYTKALLSAIPIADPIAEREREKNRIILEGDVPSPDNPPIGCNFCTRCPIKSSVKKETGIDCDMVEPTLKKIDKEKWVSCHRYQ